MKQIVWSLLVTAATAMFLWTALPPSPRRILSAADDFDASNVQVLLSDDGRWLVTNYYQVDTDEAQPGPMTLWDLDGDRRFVLLEKSVRDYHYIFSEDAKLFGAFLRTVAGDRVVVWDVATGKELRNDPVPEWSPKFLGLAFGPGDRDARQDHELSLRERATQLVSNIASPYCEFHRRGDSRVANCDWRSYRIDCEKMSLCME